MFRLSRGAGDGYAHRPIEEQGVVQTQGRTQFVGRERELGELLSLLDETRTGHGRAVLIGGEPGIGKTRLADELATRAESLEFLVLWGRAWEDAGAPAYWPWVQALRILIRSVPRDELIRHLGIGAADVAQMLPELRELVPNLSMPAVGESEAARFQLFDSATTLLRRVAAEHPLLIVLDDLHAADTPSILLLRFVASQLNDIDVLVVGTYRDLELTPDHPLTVAISEMARDRATRLMMLGGLGSDAVSDYMAAATAVRPDGLTVAAVWRETNGNPLFVGEAVRLLEAEGRLAEVGDLASLRVAVPAGVREVIARRIGHLSDDAGQALSMGAVVGPEFSAEVVYRLGELSGPGSAEALEEAARAGLLQHVSTSPGRYRFSHDLVRETLYEQLVPTRRGRLHRLIGQTLESMYANSSDAHLAELAFHYGQAAQSATLEDELDGGLDVRRRAIDYARRAAEQASLSLAYEEARDHYSMALAALNAGPEVDALERVDLLLALGEAGARAGDLDNARANFLEAAGLAREMRSAALFARAAFGYGGRHQWARAGADKQLIPLLREALELLGSDDDQLRIRLLTRLSGALRSDPFARDQCAEISQAAIDLARVQGDPSSLGYALAGRFWATWWPENPEERERLSLEITALADASGDGERLSEAALTRFMSLFEQGRLSDSRRQLDRLGEVVRQTRQPAHVWLEPVNRAEVALFDGDFALAESLIADEFRTTYRVTPGKDDISAAHMHLFLIRREQGRLAEIEGDVRRAVAEFPWYPFHKAALCCLLIELGRKDEARVVFTELAANSFQGIYHDNEWLLGISLASHACAMLEEKESAAVLYEQLLPYEGRHAVGHAEGSLGWTDTYLGLLAATVGDLDLAERHLATSIEILSEQGGLPWIAHAKHELAQVVRRRANTGDHERAAALDAHALDIAISFGLVLADQIEHEAAPAKVDLTPAPALDRALFVREGDYWMVEFGPDSFRMHDSKGMHHLAQLLRSPGQEVHALDLAQHDASSPSTTSKHAEDLELGDPSDSGPALDAQAKADYRERLSQIDGDIAEAERWNDPERVALLERERTALVGELASAIGLGGRDRVSATSSSERARVSVTRAIRASVDRIAEYSPALGAHFVVTIRTGTFCAYQPDPRAPIEWRT